MMLGNIEFKSCRKPVFFNRSGLFRKHRTERFYIYIWIYEKRRCFVDSLNFNPSGIIRMIILIILNICFSSGLKPEPTAETKIPERHISL